MPRRRGLAWRSRLRAARAAGTAPRTSRTNNPSSLPPVYSCTVHHVASKRVLLGLCRTPLKPMPRRGGGSSPKGAFPLGDIHPWRVALRLLVRRIVRASGHAGAPGESSSPLSQPEGKYDQGEANDYGEATDKGRQKRHIGIGQDRKQYAEENR